MINNKDINNVVSKIVRTRFGLMLLFNIILIWMVNKYISCEYPYQYKLWIIGLFISASVICYMAFIIQEYYVNKVNKKFESKENKNEL